MTDLNHIPEHLRTPRVERCGLLRSPILRIFIFALPGILLLAGGTTATPYVPSPVPNLITNGVASLLHPDNWPALFACSILICLPGYLLYVGADYLAEVTAARMMPADTTSAVVFRVVAYLIALAAAYYALARLLGS